MLKIEVLGPGCANCKRLEQLTRLAVAKSGTDAEIAKIVDYREIISRGVMSTPGLVIDGQVVSVGRIPSIAEITGWLTAAAPASAAA